MIGPNMKRTSFPRHARVLGQEGKSKQKYRFNDCSFTKER